VRKLIISKVSITLLPELAYGGENTHTSLWGVYTIQQTSSKCIQNTRANAGRLLDRVNTLLVIGVVAGVIVLNLFVTLL